MDELQKYNNQIIDKQNNQSIPDFEGYSPIEMQYILYEIFEKNSPIQLLELSEQDYNIIPILNQIKYLLQIIEKKRNLQLTAKGFLPTKIVSEIYNQKIIKDEMIESGILKPNREIDSMSINLTRILSELSRVVKKRNNKLSLTKKGKVELNDNHKLLESIFTTFGIKFNWAYYDGYGDNHIGQLGFGFSLVLLSKYGSEKRIDSFYSNKYFKAFPTLLDDIQLIKYNTKINQATRCYSLRTFDRFLEYFGLIKIDTEKKYNSDKYIIKTELFDKLINVQPHKNLNKSLADR